MSLAGTGVRGLVVEHLRDLIAACPSWQNWTGTAGRDDPAAAAKARTFAVDLPPPEAGADRAYTRDELEGLRPYCVVETMPGGGGLRLKKVAEQYFSQSGSLVLFVEDNVDDRDELDPAAAYGRFQNRVDALINDLTDRAGLSGNLNITAIDSLTGPERSSEQELPTIGDRFCEHLRIDYGV